jgi:hypothetical protein
MADTTKKLYLKANRVINGRTSFTYKLVEAKLFQTDDRCTGQKRLPSVNGTNGFRINNITFMLHNYVQLDGPAVTALCCWSRLHL